jgi:hypothetical protein
MSEEKSVVIKIPSPTISTSAMVLTYEGALRIEDLEFILPVDSSNKLMGFICMENILNIFMKYMRIYLGCGTNAIKLMIVHCEFRKMGEGTLSIIGSLIDVIMGDLEIEKSVINDVTSDGIRGAAINCVVNGGDVLFIKDSCFNNCSLSRQGSMGGAIFARVKSGGGVIVSGKKEGREHTLVECTASNGCGGGISLLFDNNIENYEPLLLNGVNFLLFIFYFIFMDRFTVIQRMYCIERKLYLFECCKKPNSDSNEEFLQLSILPC